METLLFCFQNIVLISRFVPLGCLKILTGNMKFWGSFYDGPHLK